MFADAWATFTANIWLYLSMPLTCGLVGYATNVLAIKMMFRPMEFFGLRTWPVPIGWQGIVPRKAGKMAAIACDTLVPDLITEEEIFNRLDAERVASEIEPALLSLVDQLVDEIMREYEPGLWESLPLRAREKLIARVQEDAPEVVAEVMEQLKANIHEVFDLKDMVVTTLLRNKALINRIFEETGEDEFVFIGRSGFYFGFLFGLVQMLGWAFYQSDWQLPAFGLAVGYLTNFIALKLIFRPQQPRKIGPFTVQGLFHKRQIEVSADYARLIADEVVTPTNIMEGVLKGPFADRVFDMIGRNVKRVIDQQSGLARPFVVWRVGSSRYIQMKDTAVARLVERIPSAVGHAERYAHDAMDLSGVLSERLQALPPDEFEQMLRPAFQEDEWILITVGAVLGAIVGILQLIAFKTLAAAPALIALG